MRAKTFFKVLRCLQPVSGPLSCGSLGDCFGSNSLRFAVFWVRGLQRNFSSRMNVTSRAKRCRACLSNLFLPNIFYFSKKKKTDNFFLTKKAGVCRVFYCLEWGGPGKGGRGGLPPPLSLWRCWCISLYSCVPCLPSLHTRSSRSA